jgi:hypothetical protein
VISALSIRYGGLLVDAADCNYESFKNLGLLCPICKKSVFLVSASNRETHTRKRKDGRTTQVRECTVPAHFNHHHDVSESEVLECELRSQTLTQTHRIAIAAKARGQRIKTMQRHFWKICKTSVKLQDIDGVPSCLELMWDKASVRAPEAKKRLYQILVQELVDQFRSQGQLEHTKATITEGIERWIKESHDETLTPLNMRPLLNLWRQKIDQRMQVLIVSEALDYVCQKMQQPILAKLVESGLYAWISAQALSIGKDKQDRIKIFNSWANQVDITNEEEEFMICMIEVTRKLIGMDKTEFEYLFYFIRDDIAQSLTFIDWAGQFEKLEKVEVFSSITPT